MTYIKGSWDAELICIGVHLYQMALTSFSSAVNYNMSVMKNTVKILVIALSCAIRSFGFLVKIRKTCLHMISLSFVELEPKYSVLTSYETDVHYLDLQFRAHHAHQTHGARHRRQAIETTTNTSISNQGDSNATVTPASGVALSSTTTSTRIMPTTTDPYKNYTHTEVSIVTLF